MSVHIRNQIVHHVFDNWQRFKYFTQQSSNKPYSTKHSYFEDMSKPTTQGSLCEIKAAAELFPYEFQVYQNRSLKATFGEALLGIKILRFTGNFNSGHFDVLVPLIESTSNGAIQADNLNNYQDPFSISEQTQSEHTSNSNYSNSNSSDSNSTQTPLTPKRGQKKRKRFSAAVRAQQLRKAASKYAEKNREVNRAAVKKYKNNHREIQKKAVEKYIQSHPDVLKKAQKDYKARNPHIKEAASAKSQEKRLATKLLPWTSKYLSGFKYNCQVNYSNDKIINLGPRSPCTWCRALKWKDETRGMCCSGGKVQLSKLGPGPEPLHSLLTHQHPMSEHFLCNVLKYNGCFQMTSFGAKIVREHNFKTTFKVQGQVYHRIGSLIVEPDQKPAFLQLYFVGDDDRERDIRCGLYRGNNSELIHQLQVMLHEHNRYILDIQAAIDSVPKDPKEFKIVINADGKPAGEHRGRFNAPQAKEVAVVIVGQDFEKRDIVLRSRGNQLMRISETHRAYDTLQYPLIFCNGEDGYHINIPKHDENTKLPLNKTVSSAEFYSFRIMERDGENSYLLLFRNLLNQFLVDMYAKIETERLCWIRHNQKTLRSEEYVHLKDALRKNDEELLAIGKMVMLPSSFTGGPRYMHERTQDAMTYVRHYGRPDLFITFTCNPKWPEITEHLHQGQRSCDRHDIIERVFNIKVKLMMKLLTVGRIFGETKCHMYTIEWQKRGLPHVHILLWLEKKIKPDSIDQIISAELPDHNLDPDLYDIIKSSMIHGPCGSFNPHSPCMVEGKCSKKYPKTFLKETETGEGGYPKYRRRSPADNGIKIMLNGIEIDNRWVVPYNPVLSRTFKAHINVEHCNSVKSIKYICKYINKGSDQASFTVEDLDEVKKYQSGRYISSSEAVWRIFRFQIHDRFPSVMHLAVHLENGQRIYYNQQNVIEKIINPPKTTLMSFFELCQVDNFAKTLLYVEVPAYYVWKNNKFLRRRKGKKVPGFLGIKKDQVLGRVYTVHPGNAECYYLRLLLHEFRGPTSFLALKTFDGVIQPTFQAACRARGLLEDDANWDHTLEEACISDSPYKIRELFATMSVKNIAVAVASSGIAATLIDGGKTAHSAFKLPLNLGYSETPICNISKQSDMAHILRETKIIIWDECTMAHKKAIEALNRTLQDIRDCKRLMGGVIVLLAGDFRQTLPVIRRGTRADEVKACLKSSILWPSVKVLSLTVNMRVHLQLNTTAAEFSIVLIDIGDGNITEIEGKINISSILCDIVPDLISLTNKIYPDIDKAGVNCGSWLKERAILTPTNDQANNINNFLLNKLLTEKVRYDSLDKVMEDEDAVHYPVEFLHTLNPPGIPPHTLNLKIGTPIMLLRNLNPPKLCNGTRLQVKVLHKNVIEATIFTGKYEGENVLIPRIPLIPSDYPFEFKRLQFPIKVCYAMTINKAQGQSLKMAGVDLRNNYFSHGQLYVACSRVSSPENLVILQPDNKSKNVVYKEVLSI
ncbi:uncharacterized protein LOC141532045 [Cotesia typhae]|uniref:uncharacterized protein LOC141532045 n=1 Tax=Cotesia typhae TaxID=2053667 RepID=UPI003D690E6C